MQIGLTPIISTVFGQSNQMKIPGLNSAAGNVLLFSIAWLVAIGLIFFGIVNEEDAGTDPTMLTHWLATVCPDGRPHVMPVWATWMSGAFDFATGATTRKGKNLAHNSHCVITVASSGLDLIVEGKATKVSDEAKLHLIAEVYASLGWHPTVLDGAFSSDSGAPSAGPPPI